MKYFSSVSERKHKPFSAHFMLAIRCPNFYSAVDRHRTLTGACYKYKWAISRGCQYSGIFENKWFLVGLQQRRAKEATKGLQFSTC